MNPSVLRAKGRAAFVAGLELTALAYRAAAQALEHELSDDEFAEVVARLAWIRKGVLEPDQRQVVALTAVLRRELP